MASRSRQPKAHGLKALDLVHTYGGFVEQPLGSCLFRQKLCVGCIEKVNQSDFGHEAKKPTLLYFVPKWMTVQ